MYHIIWQVKSFIPWSIVGFGHLTPHICAFLCSCLYSPRGGGGLQEGLLVLYLYRISKFVNINCFALTSSYLHRGWGKLFPKTCSGPWCWNFCSNLGSATLEHWNQEMFTVEGRSSRKKEERFEFYGEIDFKVFTQNPAYGRHWISPCVRIVAPIPIQSEKNRKNFFLNGMC